MALFKRIMAVIKEELFEKKPEKKKNENSPPVTGGYNSKNTHNTRRSAEVRNGQSRKTESASSKVRKTAGNPQPQKNNGQKTAGKNQSGGATATKSGRQVVQKANEQNAKAGSLNTPKKNGVQAKNAAKPRALPNNVQHAYREAIKTAKKDGTYPAVLAYRNAFKLILEYVCKSRNINAKGKSEKWIIDAVCEKLGLSSKQKNRIIQLNDALFDDSLYEDQEKRITEIQVRMNLLVTCVKSGAGVKSVSADDEGLKKNKRSFKAREFVKNGKVYDINKEHPDINKHLNCARERQSEKNFQSALYEIRMALEVIVGALGKKLSVRLDETDKLEDRIIKLGKSHRLSEEQVQILHSARKLGNKGSHHNESVKVPGESHVTCAFADIKKAVGMFVSFMSENRNEKNQPLFMSNEYYNPQRKYHGRWSRCFTYGELMMIDDFVELKQRGENGDVQAMLDIASGFLESPICWTNESLIYLKRYTSNPDPCDARYYYWVLKACETAYKDWVNGRDLPLRYIANALLESIKFIRHHNLKYRKATPQQRQQDQFTMVEKNLFGSFEGMNSQQKYIEMLLAMMNEYKEQNLFAPVHQETTAEKVQLLKVK